MLGMLFHRDKMNNFGGGVEGGGGGGVIGSIDMSDFARGGGGAEKLGES